MLSSDEKTKVLFSKIDEARELAKRLERLSKAVEERDAALYQFFAKLHYLEKRLLRLNPPRNKLEEKYGRLPKSAISTVLKLAYRGLNSKRQSKYAAVLRYVRAWAVGQEFDTEDWRDQPMRHGREEAA
jgi:septal ring factor EnvC (AmiA/AmiB activator)